MRGVFPVSPLPLAGEGSGVRAAALQDRDIAICVAAVNVLRKFDRIEQDVSSYLFDASAVRVKKYAGTSAWPLLSCPAVDGVVPMRF